VVNRVFDAIDAFAGNAPQFDDITMLALKRGASFVP
jgi:serine phosphatase RsbU (regulator of sigma subunit)